MMSWIETVRPSGRLAKITGRARPRQASGDWYKIRNLSDDEAEVLVYDEIGWFGTEAEDFVRELRQVQARRLTVRINSPGGSVFDGIAIANAIRSHPADTTVYVDGIAASIASVIAMAGDRVVMMPHSQLMIHDASGLAIGNAEEMRALAELLDKQSDNIAAVYADRAGGTVDEWRARMRAETWYSAAEAVEAGLADEMAPRRRGEEPESAEPDQEMAARWDLSVFRYAGREAAPAPVPAATAAPKHNTDVVEGTWDGGANEKRLPSPVPVATAKKVYAWYDSSQVEDGKLPKSACKLPHHEVSEDGTPGAANLNGVRNALARLPQTHGIPEGERAAVEAHLRAHLNAADNEDRAVHLHLTLDGDLTAALSAALAPRHQHEPAPEPEPGPDEWAAMVSHLTNPEPDDWAAMVAHLTSQPSSAAA